MRTTSDDVRELEEQNDAYRRIFSLLKKYALDGFRFDDYVFEGNMKHFKVLSFNKLMKNCPFPRACSRYEKCEEVACNADECSNGYAFRRS